MRGALPVQLTDRKHAQIFSEIKGVFDTYLKAALDQIEGSNNRVRDTAREDTTHHTLAVVREVVNV